MRVGELALRVGSRAGADLQRRVRLQEGQRAGNRAVDPTHQLPGHLLNRRTLRRGLQETRSAMIWFAAKERCLPLMVNVLRTAGFALHDFLRLA